MEESIESLLKEGPSSHVKFDLPIFIQTVYKKFQANITTYTVVDNQPSFTANILEGERARARDNAKIGTIVMHNLQPVERGSKHTV